MYHENVTSHDWGQDFSDIIRSMPPRENWPCIWYDVDFDRLMIILGKNNNRGTEIQNILPGVDALLLSHPALNENSFTGMTFSQGVQSLVRRLYQEKFGEQYENYRIRHNKRRILTTVACIFRAVMVQYKPTEFSIPYLDQINLMLENEPHLVVHIPL